MGGRIFVIIFGAFMDTLLCIVMELHWEGSRGGGVIIFLRFFWGGWGGQHNFRTVSKEKTFFFKWKGFHRELIFGQHHTCVKASHIYRVNNPCFHPLIRRPGQSQGLLYKHLNPNPNCLRLLFYFDLDIFPGGWRLDIMNIFFWHFFWQKKIPRWCPRTRGGGYCSNCWERRMFDKLFEDHVWINHWRYWMKTRQGNPVSKPTQCNGHY